MSANWDCAARIQKHTTTLLLDTAATDATPVVSTDLDTRNFKRTRLLLMLFTVKSTGNTGGSWVIQESATDGGTYTACTCTAPTAVAAGTGLDQQWISVLPNPAKPFVQAVFTGTDADTNVTLSVLAFGLPTGI